MSRKSLIVCLAVLVVMVLGVAVSVAVLYSGTEETSRRGSDAIPDQKRYLLLPAIPSDAVAVGCFTESEAALGGVLSGFDFPAALSESMAAGNFKTIASSRMAVSLHYNGEIQALYVFDVGEADDDRSADAAGLMAFARERGLQTQFHSCSSAGGGRDITKRAIVFVSTSETLISSALRHLEQSISVMDASGFAEASSSVSGNDLLFFSNAHARMLSSAMFTKGLVKHHSFVSDLAEWTIADVVKMDDSGLYTTISIVYDEDPSEYMTVLSNSEPASSRLSQILPSYTVSAVSLPMKDTESYMSSYQAYVDSKQSLYQYKRSQRELGSKGGIKPEDFIKRLDVKEVAKAEFCLGNGLTSVNLLRIGRQDTLLFLGVDDKSFQDYKPEVHAWPYSSYISSVFGKFFELEDESCFTYIDGWIVSGSLEAVKHYVKGYALEYTLQQYMADAGQKDLLAPESVLVAYFSLNEYPEGHNDIFKKEVVEALEPFWSGADYAPMIFSVGKEKKELEMKLIVPRLSLMKTRAPGHERDTVVTIPQGPFRVKNSGTGKMNLFYQNSHGAICLQEEGGKGLWGVPFKGKLCGTAQTIDYYANGKLQILFGSGSSVYLIDRLGHYVKGFPIDLGKEILLGPDAYDFNGIHAYNIMVLHKDNTIEMYNLKGKQPSSWKTIIAPETVKALPERVLVGGNTFWIVRTSIQTLIYPFTGGNSLTTFKGDQMIRPDSEIRIVDGSSVSVDCYDGVVRTVVLK